LPTTRHRCNLVCVGLRGDGHRSLLTPEILSEYNEDLIFFSILLNFVIVGL